MKYSKICFTLVIVSILNYGCSNPVEQINSLTWIQTNGLQGVDLTVSCFAVNGANLFAATPSGVYLTTNNGNSWTSTNTGLTNSPVNAIAVSSNNLFAGTGRGIVTQGGVFFSTNNGAIWNTRDSGLIYSYYGANIILSVSCFAVNGTKIYAGTVDAGLFRSNNDGTNWTQILGNNPFGEALCIRALAVNDSGFFVATDHGTKFSKDDGISWRTVKYPGAEAFAFSGTNIFATQMGGGVFLSTDNGANWKAMNEGLTCDTVTALVVNGSSLFAGTWGGGVFISTNNGSNWNPFNNGLKNTYIRSLVVNGRILFVGTYGSGVWRYSL